MDNFKQIIREKFGAAGLRDTVLKTFGDQPKVKSLARAVDSLNVQGALTQRFVPGHHGYNFPNKWGTDVWGPVKLETWGRCGGMSYAAMDYYYAGEDIPSTDSIPPNGSVVAEHVRSRLKDSILNNGWEFVRAMTSDPHTDALRGRGTAPGGSAWIAYKNAVVNGPVNLCLVTDKTGIESLGSCHQVTGVGFTEDPSNGTYMIHIYDSNYPNQEMVLELDSDGLLFDEYEFNFGSELGSPVQHWRAWFLDLAYQSLVPPSSAFVGTDYSDKDLRGWVPPSTNLKGCLFNNSNLSGNHSLNVHDFQDAQANRADFAGAGLTSSNFTLAELVKAKFGSANTALESAVFTDAWCQEAVFDGARLNKALFIRARCIDAYFREAFLIETDFTDATLWRADFCSAQIDKTRFEPDNADVKMVGALFREATIADTYFSGAIMDETDFSEAAITSSKFKKSRLIDAKFMEVAINNTSFKGANLRGANFTGANLVDVDLRALESYEGSKWHGAALVRCQMSDALEAHIVDSGGAVQS